MTQCPLGTAGDLARHTLLHKATRCETWARWLAAARTPELKPGREQIFEHFYFAIQAALEGLGMIISPVALVCKELQSRRLVAPLRNSVLKRYELDPKFSKI
jgi:LysR family transcriptional regulator, glycine cleavage system transcriptional activator